MCHHSNIIIIICVCVFIVYREAKKYMSCVMDSVLPICGQEVATWAKHFHESLWEAHLKHISCDPG